MLLSRGCYFEVWGIELLRGLELRQFQRKTKAPMKWRQFHDRPRPRWFEATSGFLKLSPSGPEFPILFSGKIIQNGAGVLLVRLKSDWKKQDGSES